MGILAVVIAYPYVIRQATGSSTNNVGNEVASQLFNISLWRSMLRSLVYSLIMSMGAHRYIVYMVIAALFILTAWYLVLLIKNRNFSNRIKVPYFPFAAWLAVAVMCTILAISKIGGEYVYLRYIYFIGPQIYLIGAVFVWYLAENIKMKYVGVLCAMFAVGNACLLVAVNGCTYLYRDRAEFAQMLHAEYGELDGIVVAEASSAIPTGNLINLMSFREIYMGDVESVLDSYVLQDSYEKNGESVVFINTDTYWTNGSEAEIVLEQLLDASPYSSYEKLGNSPLCEVYLLK